MVIFATGVSFITGCNSNRKEMVTRLELVDGRRKRQKRMVFIVQQVWVFMCGIHMKRGAEWRVRNDGRGMMVEEWRSEECGTTLVHTMILYTGLSISSAADYSFLQPPMPFFNVHHCCLLSLLTTNTFASSTPTDWLLLYLGCCIHN